MGWLWEGLLTNWLSALLILFFSSILAYLKARYPRWATVVLYGLCGLFLLTGSLYAFKAMTAIQKETVQITSNNIEENVKKWLEHFEIGMRKVSNPDTYFSYEVRGANNDPITISHPKAFNNYITFQAVLIVSQPHKDVLDKLKNEQVAQLALEVHLEMAKFKIENALNFPLKSLSFNNVYLQKRILITNSLTEDSFIERLNEVIFALAVARDITVLGLDRLAKENAIPRVQ